MPNLSHYIHLSPETRRDLIRLGLQSAVAAGGTYLVMRVTGLPQLSWAVMSALFVVQQSLDNTLQSAGGRLVGTVLGSAVGLASVVLIDVDHVGTVGGGWGILLRLVLCGLVMNAISVARPGLRYGVIAAAIIALEPAADNAVQGAVDRGTAILTGTLLGIAAALAIWPDPAYRRLRRHVRRALTACADLVTEALDDLAEGGGGAKLGPLHQRILLELQQAHAASGASRLHRLPGLSKGADPQRLVRVTERLWHALVLLDRVDSDTRFALERRLSDEAVAALRRVREATVQHLHLLTDSMARWEPPPQPDAVRDAVHAAEKVLRVGPENADRPSAVRIHALEFGLSELHKNLQELVDLLCGTPPEQRP